MEPTEDEDQNRGSDGGLKRRRRALGNKIAIGVSACFGGVKLFDIQPGGPFKTVALAQKMTLFFLDANEPG
jgi:hypothetical protein